MNFDITKISGTENISDFARRVYEETAKIPKGRVVTYSDIARAIGKPRAVRAVGNALHANPFAPTVPCHRVVLSSGRIGGFAFGRRRKIEMLKKEGIHIEKGRVIFISGA